MFPRVTHAEIVRGFVVHLRFADGTEGEVDLSNELEGPIFEPLQDESYFRKMSVNDDIHTIVWPNGADFAPEFLYERVKVLA